MGLKKGIFMFCALAILGALGNAKASCNDVIYSEPSLQKMKSTTYIYIYTYIHRIFGIRKQLFMILLLIFYQ